MIEIRIHSHPKDFGLIENGFTTSKAILPILKWLSQLSRYHDLIYDNPNDYELLDSNSDLLPPTVLLSRIVTKNTLIQLRHKQDRSGITLKLFLTSTDPALTDDIFVYLGEIAMLTIKTAILINIADQNPSIGKLIVTNYRIWMINFKSMVRNKRGKMYMFV